MVDARAHAWITMCSAAGASAGLFP